MVTTDIKVEIDVPDDVKKTLAFACIDRAKEVEDDEVALELFTEGRELLEQVRNDEETEENKFLEE